MTISRETRSLPTTLLFAALLTTVWVGPRARATDYIWVEGESPQSQSMTRHPWWYDKVKKDQLSGGDFKCFVFAGGPFTPAGKRKPDEKSDASEVAAEGRWAFQPPRDEFSPHALMDLHSLNEKFAGEHGFVTRSQDGNDFAFADGRPRASGPSTTGRSTRIFRVMPASSPSVGSTWCDFTATSPPLVTT